MSGARLCPDCGFPLTSVETGAIQWPGSPDFPQVGSVCIDAECAGYWRRQDTPASTDGDACLVEAAAPPNP
jgi:hypothetical protein